MDYTICYAQDRNQNYQRSPAGPECSVLRPQSYLYWYDSWEKYADKPWPELTWFDEVPVTWDETHAISGTLGEFVVVARRKGTRWYLGCYHERAIASRELFPSTFWSSIRIPRLPGGARIATAMGNGTNGSGKLMSKMDELEVTAATVLEIDMNRQVARPSCLSER